MQVPLSQGYGQAGIRWCSPTLHSKISSPSVQSENFNCIRMPIHTYTHSDNLLRAEKGKLVLPPAPTVTSRTDHSSWCSAQKPTRFTVCGVTVNAHLNPRRYAEVTVAPCPSCPGRLFPRCDTKSCLSRCHAPKTAVSSFDRHSWPPAERVQTYPRR